MNPETLPATATPAPVAAQPASTPAVSVAPTAPLGATPTVLKPTAPRVGKKQRSSKHTPAL